jgi:PAS domain S-box-containing protein
MPCGAPSRCRTSAALGLAFLFLAAPVARAAPPEGHCLPPAGCAVLAFGHSVLSAFWEANWFHALAVAALLALVGGGVYLLQNGRLRRQAERLGQGEERYRMIVEHQTEFIVRWLPDGTRTFVNESYCRYFGVSEQECLGTSFFPLVAPAYRAALLRKIASLRPDNPEATDEHASFVLGGREAWQEWTDRGLFDAEGRLVELLSVGRDISARKGVEAVLRESEARFRGAFDFAAIGMAIVAPDGRWLKVNQSLCDLLGRPAEELLATDFQSITHPDDLEADLGLVRQLLEGSVPYYHIEKRYLHKLGNVVWALLSVSLVRGGQGEPLYFISQIQDITERKLSEERMRASLREKEVLLKEVHHRVKNNLQVIKSLLSLQSAQVTDPAARRALAESRSRVRSMALIHESLYLSADMARVDFSAYVQTLCEQLFVTFGEEPCRVELRTRLEPLALDLERAVPCGMLVNELVSNALEHAFPDGRAGVVTVELRAGANGSHVLTVADNGVGLPAGIDYQQTRSLGLQLVFTLARQLSAAVAVEREGRTAFRITFGG